MTGKTDATVEDMKTKTFDQRCRQYPQLLPGTSGMQPLNQVFNYQTKQQNAQPVSNHNNTDKTNTTKEVKGMFEGNCRY